MANNGRRHASVFFAIVLSLCLLTSCYETELLENSNVSSRTLTLVSSEWEGAGASIPITGMYVDSQRLIVDPLFFCEPDGTLVPNMATAYSVSIDGRTLTITLASDLRFHDGSLVTPADVKRSFEWISEQAPYAGDFDNVQSVRVNDSKIIFYLSHPSPAFLYHLSSSFFPIIKAEEIDSKTSSELLWSGTVYGPYYVSEYISGACVILKRNQYYKNYHTQQATQTTTPPADTITVHFNYDAPELTQGMLSGEIALTDVMTPNQLYKLIINPDLEKKWTTEPNVVRLLLNNDSELFQNPNIRLAIMLLLNRQHISTESQGLYSPAYAYLVSGMNDYNTQAETYFKSNYCDQPEQAFNILEENGWSDHDGDGYLDFDGKKLEFTVAYMDGQLSTLMELLRSDFEEKGIQLNIDFVDFAVMEAGFEDDTYEAAMVSLSRHETAATLPYLCPDKNILGFADYKKLVADAIFQTNKDVRLEEYFKIQKMLMDTRCNFPIVRVNNLIVYNRALLPDLLIHDDGYIFANRGEGNTNG